ncbi:hypothetical protein LA080_003776 [Diaporthe eres]|nr:hypothetical protein LA080_003776 [Diaporthe eres]
MSSSPEGQQVLSTPNGYIVSFDDINSILKFVDSGQPFQVHVMSSPIENGQKRTQLQIRNCTESELSSDTSPTSNNTTKHASEIYDSRALVKQLINLQLTDKSVVEQILTSPRPAALSELTAAHSSKSVIPLITSKDGRVFFILAGQLPYSNCAGKYPMEFSRGPIRKLSDRALLAEKITTYQNEKLMRMVRAVSHTEDSYEFRKPVWDLRPKIWDNYTELIAEPIDLKTMHHNLRHKVYVTMADFRRHGGLSEKNARTYNGDRNKSITAAAIKVRRDIYRRMDEIPAEPPLDRKSLTQLRRIIDANDSEIAKGVDDNANEDSSDGDAVGSNVGAGDPDDSFYVLPLGKLCVARNTVAENIEDWKIRRNPGPRVPMLGWTSVEKLIQQSSQDDPVLFDLIATQQGASAAIEKGWDMVEESSEEEEDSNSEDSVSSDQAAALEMGHGGRKRRARHDPGYQDDGTNNECEPPRKMRTRSATHA